MANALIIWDTNESFSGEIAFELGVSSQNDIVESLEGLKSHKLIALKDVVLVLLDTDLEGHKRTEYYGLRFVEVLRKNLRFKGLILVYSSLSEKQIKYHVPNSSILFTSGIRLRHFKGNINIDEIDDLVSTFPRLSEDLLDDIHYNVFDNKGRIHEELHNLKNRLNDVKGHVNAEDFLTEVREVLSLYKDRFFKEVYPFKVGQLERVYSELAKNLLDDIRNRWDEHQANRVAVAGGFVYSNSGDQINKYTNQIVDLAPESNDDGGSRDEVQYQWEVLFLDDTSGVRQTVKDFFKQKKVKCHLATSEDEVFTILEKHKTKISLFIADIRLYDNNEYWCDRQGYDVIEKVNRTYDYPLVYAVLTSKKGTISKMVQKKRKYEILWFTKDDVINSDSSFSIFFDQVKNYADVNYASNALFQPSMTRWHKPYKKANSYHQRFRLKDYYKVHKEIDYSVEEAILNRQTLDWLNNEGEIKKWSCRLNATTIDNAELRKFRNAKLLGRRVILSFVAEGLMNNPKSIYTQMTGKSDPDQQAVKTFLSGLALPSSIEELIANAKDYYKGFRTEPPSMLYEEYEFLKYQFFEEEVIDEISLGYEREGFEEFVDRVSSVIKESGMRIPRSVDRLNAILQRDAFPRRDRVEEFFSELQELDDKLIKEIGRHTYGFTGSVNNDFLRMLLKKYDWIE